MSTTTKSTITLNSIHESAKTMDYSVSMSHPTTVVSSTNAEENDDDKKRYVSLVRCVTTSTAVLDMEMEWDNVFADNVIEDSYVKYIWVCYVTQR